MYTRIINNKPVWPYTLYQLKLDEPGTSFPTELSPELLVEFNVYPVVIDSKPEITYQQDANRLDPVLENGIWVQHWEIVDAANEDVQERFDQQCVIIRDQRNALLAESDWTQARDIPDALANLWQPYRQQLRDITEQSGFPFNVEWPAKPE